LIIEKYFSAMTEWKPIEHANGTVTYYRHFDWSSKQQGLVLSSFFYGYACTQFLGGVIAAKIGGHIVRHRFVLARNQTEPDFLLLLSGSRSGHFRDCRLDPFIADGCTRRRGNVRGPSNSDGTR
jgi:hypothetical protein